MLQLFSQKYIYTSVGGGAAFMVSEIVINYLGHDIAQVNRTSEKQVKASLGETTNKLQND